MMNKFEWLQVKTAQEAAKSATCTAPQLTVASRNGIMPNSAIIKAGGIDLLDLMKEGVLKSSCLVNIRSLPALQCASFEAGKGMQIGSLLTLSEIENNKDIRQRFAALAESAAHIATPNIRNVATVGGNLLQRPRCWYFRSADFDCLKKGGSHCFAIDGENKYHAIFDNQKCPAVHASTIAVALVALGASIDILGAEGKTKNIKVENFFNGPSIDVQKENSLAPNELITFIRIPDKKLRSAHLKFGEKESYDWSIADCAVALDMNGDVCKTASVVVGAVAPVPWRAREAENALAGKKITESLAREAAELALKHATPLAQNAYKVQLSKVAIERTILKALQQK